MPERLPNPPLHVPVREFTTPQIGDGFFTELIDYTQNYVPIDRGTKYSSIIGADPNVIDQFPDLYFLKETRNVRNYPYATRIWASDRLAEDSYNSAVEYVSEAVTAPTYTRLYMVRRDSYDASTTLPIGGTLTSLVAIKVLDTGINYTTASFEIDNSIGRGADAGAVFDENGKLVSVVMTNGGDGYTSVPGVNVIGDGTGAQVVAIIQPQTAYLVSQKKSELNDDHPLRNEYVLVTRVYETLPGPFVYSQKVDQDGVVITVAKRRNICANITVEEDLDVALWSQTTKTGVDNFVCEETLESRNIKIADGVYPFLETTRVDEDGKPISVVRQVASKVYVDAIDPREYVSTVGGKRIWARISSEGITELKVWEVVELRELPGNPIRETKFDKNGDEHHITRTMKEASLIVSTQTLIGTTWTSTTAKAISELVSWEIVETMTVPGVIVPSSKIDETYGMVFDTRKQVVPSTDEAGIIGGFYTDIKSLDDLRSISVSTKLDPDSLPEDVVWFGGQRQSFPPELTDASYLFAEGAVGCCDSFSIALIANIKKYSGMCDARYTEQFFLGPPPNDISVDQFFPRAHHFGFAWASACPPSHCKSGAPNFFISESLHPLINLTLGLFVTTLAATVPTVLPHDEYIMLAPQVERWRFGVFRRILTEILVPPAS